MSQVPYGDYTQLRVITRSPSDKEEPSNELVTSGKTSLKHVKQTYLPEYDFDETNEFEVILVVRF